jgi:hypothetical protein
MRQAELSWCDETLALLEPLEQKEARAAKTKRNRSNV